MQQTVNRCYSKLFTEHPRYFILMGGRGAGRSTVASQFALAKLVAPQYFRCAIMRYVLGDIRNSIYREITDRAEENDVLDKIDVNDSQMVIKYGVNTINAVGFKKSSGDQKAKLKSLANYNCVIIEEADEIPEEDFMQLDDSLRTLKSDIVIILLLNPPPRTHWIVQRWFDLLPSGEKDFYIPRLKDSVRDTIYIRTSYKDNVRNLASQSVAQYESYRVSKPSHYWNMVMGLVPEVVRGKVFSGWQQIDSVPHEARLLCYGLDFGYTNDPSAIVAIYRYNGGIILDEIAYTKGLQNNQIAAILNNQTPSIVVADCAEPKSIDELILSGLTVIPSKKGTDSIKNGIDNMQAQRISVTRRSANIWHEYCNYAWHEDKDGKMLNKTKPGYDHAMDAARYGISAVSDTMNETTARRQSDILDTKRHNNRMINSSR
ncbi:MAG: phage terminase large subunit [Patescibacteria group bacterium]|nr:phage terminase large subunit [Patescibacteria group bacterium]